MKPASLLDRYGPREAMEYGEQIAAANGEDVSEVRLEKDYAPGAHILSSAVIDPIALNELFPNWKE